MTIETPIGLNPGETHVAVPAKPPAMGARLGRHDAVPKVTGETRYGGDFYVPGMLHAQIVRAHHPHAEIISIDKSEALKLPGVIEVLTGHDMPGTNMQGLIRRDQECIAVKKVRYLGDAVAVVVATDRRTAEIARDLVKVEYKVLPGVFTIDQALAPDAPQIHEHGNRMGGQKIRKGDAIEALKTCDVIVEHTLDTQSVDHAFLDIEAGMAQMDGETLVIQAAGQWVHEEARLVALALAMPLEHVRIIQPPTGGAFGGREDIGIQIFLGLATLKTGKPVHIQYTRAESMIARHKRHPLRIHYKLGAMKDGTLVAAQVEIFADEGAYASTGIAVLRKAASHTTGPYRVPNVHVDAHGLYTNQNPTGAMRGFGACQLAICYEQTMDKLAEKLGVDRVALRRQNLITSGETVATTQVIPVASALACLDEAARRIGWDKRDYTVDPKKPWLKRGYGISSFCFGLGYGDGFPDASRARVRLGDLGVIELYSGACEVGQGLSNMCAQIAGEELGLDPMGIQVFLADTATTPEAGSSSATRQTFFTGNAVRLAATELKKILMDVAGTLLPVHPEDLAVVDGAVIDKEDPSRRVTFHQILAEARRRGIALEAKSHFQPNTVTPTDHDTGLSPRAFITYLFGAHACELTVDTETGQVHVERIVAVHDVGRAINPLLVEGQIEGGVAQGLGMALMEEVIMRDGKIMNPGFTDYILPTTVDVPPIEAVYLEHYDPEGPFGAHGVGEPPLIGTPPAILGAIHDAIGVQIPQTPATPERVWKALQGR
ncbi:MAG: aerobic-type carbon monoxide dehydrogenase, large subunit CoxL/CutL-like protein [Cyanobacteria bacterium RYN_339]|nr:aerobic-type carbon monoxide dehydrogenase, large subunit CoxL/CutL-like protein [Cyanobacteria bacterium RYN_339]